MSCVDFNTIPANVPSMCIPRAFKNITRERVIAVFKDLDLGTIERVDMIAKENEKGDKFQRIFIHFKHWNGSANATRAREMLISGKEIKVVYDDPWFWKISANKSARSAGGGGGRKPTIKFDDSPRPKAVKFEPRSPSSSPPCPTFERSPSPEFQVGGPATPEKNLSVDCYQVPALQPKKKRVVKKPFEIPAPLQISEEGEESGEN